VASATLGMKCGEHGPWETVGSDNQHRILSQGSASRKLASDRKSFGSWI